MKWSPFVRLMIGEAARGRGADQARGGRSILHVWCPPPGEAFSRHASR
jgi:hypothetical protein